MNYLPFKIGEIPFHYIFTSGLVLLLISLSWLTEKRITLFDKWLLFVIAGFCLSLISSVDRLYTIRSIGSFIFRGLGIAFISQRILKNNGKTTSSAILICASLVCIVGLIEFFFHWNPFSKFPSFQTHWALSPRSGMAGTMGHPLVLSGYLVLVLPIAIWYIRGRNIILKSIPLLLISLTIFFSFSRSSWILSLMLMFFYFYTEKNEFFIRKWKLLLSLIIIITFFFLFTHSKPLFIERFGFQSLKSSIVHSHRSASYNTTWTVLKKYPFFGVGLGNYPIAHDFYRAEDSTEYLKTPDNVFLRFLCEIGLIGTAMFIMFIIYWLHVLWKHRMNSYIFAIFLGLSFFMLNQLVADLFYWLAPQFTFWMLLGIAVGNLKNNKTII